MIFLFLRNIGKEKEEKRSQLVGLSGVMETNFGATIFYKVPFKAALPLIAKRDVYLEYGYAYVPFTKVVSLIIQRFRMTLSKQKKQCLESKITSNSKKPQGTRTNIFVKIGFLSYTGMNSRENSEPLLKLKRRAFAVQTRKSLLDQILTQGHLTTGMCAEF